MGLLLNVPYSEKDEAKVLGARWNPDLKKWYAPSPQKYPLFYKWMDLPSDEVRVIVIDYFYIVEGIRTCFKCGKKTKVVCFGVEKIYEVLNPDEYGDDIELFHYYSDKIHLIPSLPNTCFANEFWDYMKTNYHFYQDYSKQGGTYKANHCHFCNSIQGEFHLFCEPDSPFFINNGNDAAKLTLHKIHLKNDIITGDIVAGENPYDSLIKPYAKIINTDLSL